MKGIAHFVTGVALATFFPEVVQGAAEGAVLPVLGGIAGILPDTLDFKFVRYFERYDTEIDPGPEPDAREVAEQVAGVMRRAYETGEPQTVMLHTIRLGADAWRQYGIRFDAERGEVAVGVGPIVDTGQVPIPGSEAPPLYPPQRGGGVDLSADGSPTPALSPPQGGGVGLTTDGSPPSIPPTGGEVPFGGEVRVEVGVPLVHTYDEEIKVDIFSGPSFRFERRGERLYVEFLHWHRRWSHSLTLATALGLGTAGIGAVLQLLAQGGTTRMPLWAGLVVGLGFLGHVLEDQLGFMGSNLLYPFTRDRSRGLRLLRSGDAVPNFLTVWTAAMVIVFNLDRFSAQPRLDAGWFLGLAVVLPVILLGGAYQWRRRGWAATR